MLCLSYVAAGVFETTLCGYGYYAAIAVAYALTATASPRPDFIDRVVNNGKPDVAGPVFVTFGLLFALTVFGVAYSYWHERAREEVMTSSVCVCAVSAR